MFPFYWFCNYWKIIIKIKESIYEWINTVSQEWKALGTLTKKNNSLSLLKKKSLQEWVSSIHTLKLCHWHALITSFLKKDFWRRSFFQFPRSVMPRGQSWETNISIGSLICMSLNTSYSRTWYTDRMSLSLKGALSKCPARTKHTLTFFWMWKQYWNNI